MPVDKLATTEVTPEIAEFNQLGDGVIGVKTGVTPGLFPPDWILPETYKYLDLDLYLVGLVDRIEKDDLYAERFERLTLEIALFRNLGLNEVLRTLIFVVDRMREAGAVWGVGRGSSCSSYLLYLLGLHCVDPVRYDIQITDFIRTEE